MAIHSDVCGELCLLIASIQILRESRKHMMGIVWANTMLSEIYERSLSDYLYYHYYYYYFYFSDTCMFQHEFQEMKI